MQSFQAQSSGQLLGGCTATRHHGSPSHLHSRTSFGKPSWRSIARAGGSVSTEGAASAAHHGKSPLARPKVDFEESSPRHLWRTTFYQLIPRRKPGLRRFRNLLHPPNPGHMFLTFAKEWRTADARSKHRPGNGWLAPADSVTSRSRLGGFFLQAINESKPMVNT